MLITWAPKSIGFIYLLWSTHLLSMVIIEPFLVELSCILTKLSHTNIHRHTCLIGSFCLQQGTKNGNMISFKVRQAWVVSTDTDYNIVLINISRLVVRISSLVFFINLPFGSCTSRCLLHIIIHFCFKYEYR